MLLWSVMPEDVVWQGFGRTSPYREINREGRFYLMNEKGKVERLISTNPMDYL